VLDHQTLTTVQGVRRYLAALLLLMFSLGSLVSFAERAVAVNQSTEPKGSLSFNADAQQPFGLPVFLTVTVTNSGAVPFFYWSGRGSDGYPQGESFAVSVLDSQKKTVPAQTFNGAYAEGSGTDLEVAPGKTLKFPLTITALPPGTYDLKLSSMTSSYMKNGVRVITWPDMVSDKKVRVTVKKDSVSKHKMESDLFQRAVAGEFFATRVVNRYGIAAVTDKLPPLLESDSVKDAFNVAIALGMTKNLPAGCGKHINNAMSKNLKRTPSSYEATNLMVYLAEIAKRAGDDQSLDAVLNLAKNGPTVESRWHAVLALTKFKQPAVLSELRHFAQSKETAIKGAAAVGLAERDDAAAVPVLIEVAKTNDGYQSWNAVYRALARFPSNESARAAIRDGMKSSDASLKRAAEEAAKMLR
jgi:hypothetical protein